MNTDDSIKLDNEELIAIYAALVHGTEVCDIFWEQDAPLKQAAGRILDRVTDLMELRGLLE